MRGEEAREVVGRPIGLQEEGEDGLEAEAVMGEPNLR